MNSTNFNFNLDKNIIIDFNKENNWTKRKFIKEL